MALPAGISTATVTVGAPVTFSGLPVKTNITITPSAFLVHTATGHPLVNMIEEATANDGVAVQFTLPHTDQAGFQDEAGNAYQNWYYTATIQYQMGKVTKPAFTKVFQLAVGQTTVDLDLLPSGSPAMPYTAPVATVTSVASKTGAVTALDVINDPAAVTALNATYAGKDEGGYLFSCFRADPGSVGGDQALSIAFSEDGTNFYDSSYGYIYLPANYPTNVVRDPSIIWREDQQMFFICHTDTGATGTTFSVIKSPTLLEGSFTLVTQINVTDPAGVYSTWAPEFYEDGADVYIYVTLRIGSNGTYTHYWLKATSANLSTWTAPAVLPISGGPANKIDATVIKKGATYYMFYVDQATVGGGAPSIMRATGTSPIGPFTTDKTGDWMGLGTIYYEGPSVVQMHDGKYRVYLDSASLTNDMGYYFAESTDLETWGTVQPVNRIPGDVSKKYRHGTILPISKAVAAKIGELRKTINAPRFVGKPPGQNQTAPAGVYPATAVSGGSSYPGVYWANGVHNVRAELAPNGEWYMDKPGVASSEILRFLTSRARFGGAVQPKSYTTATRPTGFDSSVAGAVIYDSTLGKSIMWSGSAWVNLDGSPLTTVRKKAVQLGVDVTFNSTTFANFGDLAGTFTPVGPSVLVEVGGTVSPTGGAMQFQAVASGGSSVTIGLHGGVEGSNGARTATGRMYAVFTGLTPGVAVTFTVQAKQVVGGTTYCRPAGQANEGMLMTIEEVS